MFICSICLHYYHVCPIVTGFEVAWWVGTMDYYNLKKKQVIKIFFFFIYIKKKKKKKKKQKSGSLVELNGYTFLYVWGQWEVNLHAEKDSNGTCVSHPWHWLVGGKKIPQPLAQVGLRSEIRVIQKILVGSVSRSTEANTNLQQHWTSQL